MARLQKSKSKIGRKGIEMITSVLSAITEPAYQPHHGFAWGTIIILLIYAGILALILVGLIRFIKFLSSVPKEQKLLRMELGKLAEEVHQIRKELKDKEA